MYRFKNIGRAICGLAAYQFHVRYLKSMNSWLGPQIDQNKASSVAILIIITFFVTWLPNQVTSIIIYMRAVKGPRILYLIQRLYFIGENGQFNKNVYF